MPVFSGEHAAFEQLLTPVIVVREDRFHYANRSWEKLIGRTRDELFGLEMEPLLELLLLSKDRGWIRELAHSHSAGIPTNDEVWVQVRCADGGARLMRSIRSVGPLPGELTYVMVEADEESRVRNFTDALASGAAGLVHCRDEESVYQRALDLLQAQGLSACIVFVEADGSLHQGPMRQPQWLLDRVDASFGQNVPTIRYDRSKLPHVDEIERTRRACYHQDMQRVIGPGQPEALRKGLESGPLLIRGVDAPLFVQNRFFGLLSAYSADLTPTQGSAVELFATHVANALENVRHHIAAQSQLAELERLQGEVVARERLSVLGEAAAVVAHEIQNPLGAILNGISLLKQRQIGPPQDEVLRMMEEEASALERLAHDMLAYARPFVAVRAEQPLRPLLFQTVAQNAHSAAEKRVQVEVRDCLEQVNAKVDAKLLLLALSNLVRNAIQASPAGSRVQLGAQARQGNVVVFVEDNGPGVPEEKRRRVFQPFFTTRAQGSGLGLALVERVVHAHGGTVNVENVAPHGARFEVELPVG